MEINATPGLDLSLYQIETGLAELVEYRQARLMDPEQPASEEEVVALDAEIRRYEIAKPQKVTGVVGVFRSWAAKRATAKAEVKRLQGIIAHLEMMEEALKGYCTEILERLPEPKRGPRKLVGVDGSSLTLKGDGGLAPLEITDSAAIPDEYCRFECSFTAIIWEAILERCPDWGLKYDMKRVPDNALIREALAQPCPTCGGRSRIEFEPDKYTDCVTCGGSGRNAIPGARLLERGKSVIVK